VPTDNRRKKAARHARVGPNISAVQFLFNFWHALKSRPFDKNVPTLENAIRHFFLLALGHNFMVSNLASFFYRQFMPL
jgi:hypothetical protein